MRKLWTEPSVTYDGSYHRVTGAGLAPLPIQRPIPVWFGGSLDRARSGGPAGSVTAGFRWSGPGPKLEQARQQVAQAATEAGRDPAESVCRARFPGTAAPKTSPKVSGSGRTRAPPMSRSTP